MGWMGKKDRQVSRRIVALLFEFAALAELAGTKPRPLRAAVLWLLGAAEAVGRDFVAALAVECGGGIVVPARPPSPEVADDAIRLAHSFRALAGLLGDMLRRRLAPLSPGRLGCRPIRDVMAG